MSTNPPDPIEESILKMYESELKDFFSSFQTVQQLAHANAVRKGFWGTPGNTERNFGEAIALVHSELSEALESWRAASDAPDEHVPTHESVAVELADAIIRIMDIAEGFGYNVAEALVAKIAFNAGRPHKHGKAI